MRSNSPPDGSFLLLSFELASPHERDELLKKLEQQGLLHAIIERAVASTRAFNQKTSEENKHLKKRIKVLESENAALKKRCVTRLTRPQRKALVQRLSNDGLDSKEISEKMTADGEAISPGAIRQLLSRKRRER